MDTTTPIACDMTGAADTGPERMMEYERLFREHLIGRSRTPGGIEFSFRADAGVEAWVRDLAAREKACCPFFDFTIVAGDGEIRWLASVVDDDIAREILEEFYELPDTVADGVAGLEDRLAGRGLIVTANAAGTVMQVAPGSVSQDR
jgi:hypothetical protein